MFFDRARIRLIPQNTEITKCLGTPALPQTVLSIVSTLWRCGPTSVLEGIVRGYDPANYQATIATLSPNPRDSALSDFHSLGIQVEEMNLSRPASFVFGPRRLAEMIQALKIDLVHCHAFRATILFSRCKSQVPSVSTIHSDLVTDYQLLYPKALGKWMARREYAALHRFARVVAVSDTVAEAARSHGLECEVITNGIDLNAFHPPSSLSEKSLLRQRLGLPLERTVVLHTGRLTSVKRPVEVVGGFLGSRLSENAVLLIAGEGPLRQQCEQAAAGANNISFLGKRQDIPDLLRASDVLISNSSSEGLPMSLLEGCACGTHVIASDIPSHNHIRDMFAQQVFIYSGHGPQAVAAALDANGVREKFHILQPSRESLDAISASNMSRAYQRLYDDLSADDTYPRRTAVSQT
jgi:glycosyltransferase involved in cell wall biosynthesis